MDNVNIDRSPIVRSFALHCAERTEKMRQDLLKRAEVLFQDPNVSGESLQKKVLELVNKELKFIQAFNEARVAVGSKKLLPQISTNKMKYILEEVEKKFKGEEGDNAFAYFCQARFRQDPSFEVQYPLLQTNSYFGSNRATIDAASMFLAQFATSEKSMADYANTNSSIAHVVPCADLPPSFINSGSKFVMNYQGTPGFAVPHGGYAFGGQRHQPNKKEFGFEDCSSIVSNVLYPYSQKKPTYDFLSPNEKVSTFTLLQAWRHCNTDSFLDELFLEKNPILADVQPGDIYVTRTFKKEASDPHLNDGVGGHTGVVIAKDPQNNNNVLIFESNRDMEREDPKTNTWGVAGVGCRSVNAQYQENEDGIKVKHTLFLRCKPKP